MIRKQIFWLICLFWGCNIEIQESRITDYSVYYWQTVFDLSQEEIGILEKNNVNKLYIRYFDIDINSVGEFIPKGIIKFNSIPHQDIIPTIFITNRTFEKVSKEEIPILVDKLWLKINSINVSIGKSKISELQIDCDWTQKTRPLFFFFLEELKSKIDTSIILSTTIRLHQIKFPGLTGIPPVDRGSLMVYNVGDLTDFKTKNSIFDPIIIARYLDKLHEYPLELDVAFPIFNQQVIFRNEKFLTVLRKKNYLNLNDSQYYEKTKKTNYWRCIKDMRIGNIYIAQGDIIRDEVSYQSGYDNIVKKVIKSIPKQSKMTYIIFDFSHLNTKKRKDEKLVFPKY